MHILSRKKWLIFWGLFPALLVYTVVAIYPIGSSVYYSLMEWDGLTGKEFVGFKNYVEALTDPDFWHSFKNNIYVVLASVFGQISIALFIALILNRQLRGTKFFRTVGFLPVVVSTVIISLTWNMIYNSEVGLINSFLNLIGLDSLTQNWLGDPTWAMISVCITVIWQFVGIYMIIFLAALQTIPNELYEAAEIDGASEWAKTWKVTIPIMWETIIVAVILCISGSLRTFDLIYVMTSGGPANSTEVMALYMFDETFSSFRYGYGSAISILIFVFSLTLIFITTKLMRRKLM